MALSLDALLPASRVPEAMSTAREHGIDAAASSVDAAASIGRLTKTLTDASASNRTGEAPHKRA